MRKHVDMPHVDAEWFEQALGQIGAKKQDMARAVFGREPSAATRFLSGERALRGNEPQKLADFIDQPVLEVAKRAGMDLRVAIPTVTVANRVGAGQRIANVDPDSPGGGRRVPCPLHIDPSKVVAVEVSGESMWPMQDRWLLFYTRDHLGVTTDELGKLCVVETENEEVFVKMLRRGSKKGTFTLHSWSADPIEDVVVRWAARVLAIIPA